MTLKTKQTIILVLGIAFLISLLYVQRAEVVRREQEVGLRPAHVIVPENSKKACNFYFPKTRN